MTTTAVHRWRCDQPEDPAPRCLEPAGHEGDSEVKPAPKHRRKAKEAAK